MKRYYCIVRRLQGTSPEYLAVQSLPVLKIIQSIIRANGYKSTDYSERYTLADSVQDVALIVQGATVKFIK